MEALIQELEQIGGLRLETETLRHWVEQNGGKARALDAILACLIQRQAELSKALALVEVAKRELSANSDYEQELTRLLQLRAEQQAEYDRAECAHDEDGQTVWFFLLLETDYRIRAHIRRAA